MKLSTGTFGAAIATLVSTASAQDLPRAALPAPEAQEIVATPDIRSVVVDRDLDKNHDLYLTLDEIGPALGQTRPSTAYDTDHRRLTNHRDGSWIYNSPPLPVSSNDGGAMYRWLGNGDYRPVDWSTYSVRTATRAPPLRRRTGSSRRTFNLKAAEAQVLASGSDRLSLVDEEFHRMFADLPGVQRSALLVADIEGNNDGMVTLEEFYGHNERRFSRKARFEADFGEDAYLEVLRRFGVSR